MIERLSEDINLSIQKPSKCAPFLEVKLNTPIEEYDYLDILGFCSKCPGIKMLKHGLADFLFGIVPLRVIFSDAPSTVCDKCQNVLLPPKTASQICQTTEFIVGRFRLVKDKSVSSSYEKIKELLLG